MSKRSTVSQDMAVPFVLSPTSSTRGTKIRSHLTPKMADKTLQDFIPGVQPSKR